MTISNEVREAHECAKCHVTDTHSKHTIFAMGRHPVTGVEVDFSVEKHIQCCADDGCEICTTDVEMASGTAAGIGEAFTQYMQHKTDEHLGMLMERHGIQVMPAEGEEPSVR